MMIKNQILYAILFSSVALTSIQAFARTITVSGKLQIKIESLAGPREYREYNWSGKFIYQELGDYDQGEYSADINFIINDFKMPVSDRHECSEELFNVRSANITWDIHLRGDAGTNQCGMEWHRYGFSSYRNIPWYIPERKTESDKVNLHLTKVYLRGAKDIYRTTRGVESFTIAPYRGVPAFKITYMFEMEPIPTELYIEVPREKNIQCVIGAVCETAIEYTVRNSSAYYNLTIQTDKPIRLNGQPLMVGDKLSLPYGGSRFTVGIEQDKNEPQQQVNLTIIAEGW
ncbi:hypothetical protein L7834_019470 [Providencia rettgeri]|nr:hypothetical protein [Providencia rettgeri]